MTNRTGIAASLAAILLASAIPSFSSAQDSVDKEKTEETARIYDDLSASIDDFFSSGFIAYATRNEAGINYERKFNYYSLNDAVTFKHSGHVYWFYKNGDVLRDENDYEMGTEPDLDIPVAQGVTTAIESIMTKFDNLDLENPVYVVVDPDSDAHKAFFINKFAEGTACQLYRPDSQMGQFFIEQAREEGIEFNLENALSITENPDGSFVYELFTGE